MDVPRTLLVTNDYPPQVGGIQRTLEALVRRLPPDRVAVLCPNAERHSFVGGPYAVPQPEIFLWPSPGLGGSNIRSSFEPSGPVRRGLPLALLGPSLAGDRGPNPYLAAAIGSSTGSRSRQAPTARSSGAPRPGRLGCR